MQMPARVVEDASIQCVPVSRTRKVEKIVSSEAKKYGEESGKQNCAVPGSRVEEACVTEIVNKNAGKCNSSKDCRDNDCSGFSLHPFHSVALNPALIIDTSDNVEVGP